LPELISGGSAPKSKTIRFPSLRLCGPNAQRLSCAERRRKAFQDLRPASTGN
jgi:hypothetical protein